MELGIIDKSGAWFAFGAEKLGQGKEKVRTLLDETPELRNAIEAKVIEHLGMHPNENLGSDTDTDVDMTGEPADGYMDDLSYNDEQ